nr:MAG TPA: hypothetical protein [Caudoviricetes sp.]
MNILRYANICKYLLINAYFDAPKVVKKSSAF